MFAAILKGINALFTGLGQVFRYLSDRQLMDAGRDEYAADDYESELEAIEKRDEIEREVSSEDTTQIINRL